MTSDLEATLDALVVDAPVDRADWSDVQRRAQRPRRRRTFALAGALALMLIAVVTPAFGLGGRVLDLFEGTPASPQVQQVFADWNSNSERWGTSLVRVPAANVASAQSWLSQTFPQVDPSKAHGLFSIELGPGVVVQLWGAPITDGGVCAVLLLADQANDLQGRGGSTRCITNTTSIAPRGGGTRGMGGLGRGVKLGTAPGAASVELRFADGKTLRAPVVEGFYLVPVNIPGIESRRGKGAQPGPRLGLMETQIVSYDEHGKQLAETTTDQKVIADYLGLTVAELWTTDRPSYSAKNDPNTLAKMATDRGKSVSGLANAIAAHWNLRIDAQAAAGLITAAEQTSQLAHHREVANAMVHGVPPPGFDQNTGQPLVATPPAATGGGRTPSATNISIVSVTTVFPPQRSGSHPLVTSPRNGANEIEAGFLPVLAFEVTIHNGGDAPETDVPVTLTLDRPNRPGDPIVRTVTVDTIGPNETKTTTVTFHEPPATFGVPTPLRATAANGPDTVYPIIFSLPTR